jgi:hypothetical protein
LGQGIETECGKLERMGFWQRKNVKLNNIGFFGIRNFEKDGERKRK